MTQARDKANIPVLNFASKGIDDNATSTAMTIDSSKNVGINTSSPSLASGNGVVISGGSSVARLELRNTTSGTTSSDGAFLSYSANDLFLGNRESGNSIFYTNNAERMRIKSDGTVGIGTSSPTATLSVDGSVIFNESSADVDFRVESNGNANMLFVNGGNDRIGIANSAPLNKLDVQASADNEDLIRLSHPSSPANAGALLGFNSDGTTDNNVITLGVHYSNDFYDVLNIQRSTRNVGIGTVNPQEQLDITSNVPRIRFTDLSVTNLRHVIGSEANDLEIRCDDGNVQATSHIGFKIDGSEKVRMTDTGRVGIGTSTPGIALDVNGTIGVESGNSYRFGNNGNTRIEGSNATNVRLGFFTGGSERMRIDSSGRLAINTTSPDTGSIVSVNHEGSTSYGLSLNSTTTSGTQYHLRFARGGTNAGYITSNSATTIAVNNASDERLKENIENSGSAIQDIKDIQVRQFDWIDNIDTHRDFGFVAQELVNVVPEAVTQGTDELDENGKPVRSWGVDYSHIVPRLVKVCQEQQTKIEILEARITTLENN